MKPIFVVLIITGAIILLFALFLYYIYYRIFQMTRRGRKKALDFNLPFVSEEFKAIIQENTKKLANIPHEDVYVKAFDGKILHGYYYHQNDNSPLEIDFHGYKGQAFRDFSGGALQAIKEGHNLLLVDERAHGLSGGATITFGVKERQDVLSWINYANSEIINDNPIILTGISMGAATVLMASNLDLPKNVKGIIADCPYTSPLEIISVVLDRMKLSSKLLRPFVVMSAFIFGHFKINEAAALSSVKDSKVPILLIHGESDSFVPFEMGKRIAQASSKIEFYTFPNADHGLSYVVDSNRYLKIVKEFTNKILKEEGE